MGRGGRGGGFGGPPRFGGRGGGRGGGGGGSMNGGIREKYGQPGERLRKPNWDTARLTPFEKNFYKEHPDVTRRSQVRISEIP